MFRSLQRLGRLAVMATALLPGTALSAELLVNGGFDNGSQSWWSTSGLVMDVNGGRMCADIPGSTAVAWDVIIGQNKLALEKGGKYRLSFNASGTPRGPIRALVQMAQEPHDVYASLTPSAAPDAAAYEVTFTSPVTMDDAQLVFQLGGQAEPWRLCLMNVSLQDGDNEEATPAPSSLAADAGPRIRINQVGYLPDGPKRATLITDARKALNWRLLDGAGAEVLTGKSKPRDMDKSAGAKVHTIDFSETDRTGSGFVLEADGAQSAPFTIAPDIYSDLARDAFGYFYPVRSGIAIDGAIAGAAYARPAGHVNTPSDGAANKGDKAVPCQAPDSSEKVYGEPWTCGYTLDVTGGWYDAGDHGKYVVNGSISVAQLMSAFERSLYVEGASKTLFADGALAIPESSNGVPDILDEARWELEFLLKMMVPDGEPLAGMAHHKIHDSEWTGLPLMPHLDDKIRELHRPSTAATLNLAAAAAQGARLFKTYDGAFSETLLAAARKAYAAAEKNPSIYAPEKDGNSGGGAYNDDDVTDEFYWAAVELFVTTGEDTFYRDLTASKRATGKVFGPSGFDWAHVAALGRFSLALVPNRLSEKELKAVRGSIVTAANGYLETQAGQPFGHPYAPAEGKYEWGSNHMIAQIAIVLSRAHDMTGDRKYREGVLESLDYLFGRNALDQSYVTGYGTKFSKNQHSRWFANQIDPSLPNPPKGSLAGGPNSAIQDPVAQKQLAGCAPQLCYIDEIESWSTNEITINWNAALAQLSAFVVEQ